MSKYRILLLVLIFLIAPKIGRYGAVAVAAMNGLWCSYLLPETDRSVRIAAERLESLHERTGAPQPGEWRYSQIEPVQTFAQFVLSAPTRMTAERNRFYIQPIGHFSEGERKIVDLTAEFLGLSFCCEVEVLPDVDENVVAAEAIRIHPHTLQTQFLAPWIHDVYLKPRLPDDAAVSLALTATDLWPGEDWNFVFGQANLKNRVGVWSMARFGDPDVDDGAFLTCLRRTLKVATHETCHMFSMHHCQHYKCNMAAGNNLEECDQYPLYLCPDCVAKLHWSLRPDISQRFVNLARFCRRNSLADEATYYTIAAEQMSHVPVQAE